MADSVPPAEFSTYEKQVLLKILDAMFADLGEAAAEELVGSLRGGGGGAPEEEIRAFARRPASKCCDVMAVVQRRVAALLAHDRQRLHVLLRALASPAGCLALTGRRGPLYALETAAVQDAMIRWFASPLMQVRELAKVFKMLLAVVCMGAPDGEQNPNWKAIGYSGPDAAALRGLVSDVDAADFSKCRVDMSLLDARSLTGGASEIMCDCVVVGSGPGGAVVAAELTEAGFRVALLETGRWKRAQERKCSELECNRDQYQSAGQLFTEDRNFTILAGAAFGGGAAVNWSCCLPPPESVCQEWARKFGLEWAAGPAMGEAVERARERLSMHTDGVELNAANEVLMRGCHRLGYPAEVAAQQGWQPKSPDDGGWCSLGWKHGPRQGTHGSALLDAARTGRLLLLDGCTAHQVVRDGAGRACGVRATLLNGTSRSEVTVRGRGVVVAGGALQTPLLLRRSGLRNRHIGRHLRLHPAMTFWGRFEEPIRFFQGAPMTTVSRVVEDQDGHGYGAKIWVPNFHPLTWGVLSPWQGAQEFKQSLTGYGHAAPLISIVRDQSEGKVWQDSNGRLRVSYVMRDVDKGHLQRAVEHAARILVAAGAREVHSAHNTLAPLRLGPIAGGGGRGVGDGLPELEAWLASLRAAGMPRNGVALGSAHQMGTCRMAASPALGAARPTGETWEVPGLFVADTSAFPTASGVNPMWTCAALAYHVAQEVRRHLEATPTVGEPCLISKRNSCTSARAMAPTGAPAPKPGRKCGGRSGLMASDSEASTHSGSGSPRSAAQQTY